MATLTIRNLPDVTRDKLRIRAAQNRRSMEAEARDLLTRAVEQERAAGMVDLSARVRRAQETVARYIPVGTYSVDRYLAERREEAAAEDAKWSRLAREAAPSSGNGPRG